MSELNDRVCLITGANRGIGRALADRFVAAGARCIFTARSPQDVAALRETFTDVGERVTIESCDIGIAAEIAALVQRIRAYAPHIDVLVNNAGVFPQNDRWAHPSDVTAEVMRETFDVNLFGTIAMCQMFLATIPRGGRIINVSSTMGQFGEDGLPPYATAYCVSKTALNAYTSALANEVAERGILVDCLHPGWVQTDMGGEGAQITPEAATETVMFLASRAPGETGKFWFEKRVIPW